MKGIKLEFEENAELNDVIDTLISYKKTAGMYAYTIFNGTRYDNSNIDELIKFKKHNYYENSKEEKQSNYIFKMLMTKKFANESLRYWVNQTKKVISSELEDNFEYDCYYYLQLDKEDFKTIKYACYYLYNIQTNFENSKQILDKIMIEADSNFNYRIFYNIVSKYTNSVEYIENLLNDLLKPIDNNEEVAKIKRLINNN